MFQSNINKYQTSSSSDIDINKYGTSSSPTTNINQYQTSFSPTTHIKHLAVQPLTSTNIKHLPVQPPISTNNKHLSVQPQTSNTIQALIDQHPQIKCLYIQPPPFQQIWSSSSTIPNINQKKSMSNLIQLSQVTTSQTSNINQYHISSCQSPNICKIMVQSFNVCCHFV